VNQPLGICKYATSPRQLLPHGHTLFPDSPQAGVKLGLRPLQAYCTKLLGERQAALSLYTYADVQRANASGKVGACLSAYIWSVQL
jgi:hypothetical protein